MTRCGLSDKRTAGRALLVPCDLAAHAAHVSRVGLQQTVLLIMAMQNGASSTLNLWVCQWVSVTNTQPITGSDLKVQLQLVSKQ